MKRYMYRFLIVILMLGLLSGGTGALLPSANALDTSNCVMLSVPWEYIQQCGNQVSSGNKKACQAYAFTYCRIILDNAPYEWTRYRYGNSGQMACAPSTAKYNSCTNTKSEQSILRAIYDNINLGRPVMLRARSSSSPFHYIVAIGYKTDCNPNALSQSDIVILDPWDGATKSLTSVSLKKTEKGYYGYWTAMSGGASIISAGTPTQYCTITFDPNGGSVSPTTQTIIQGCDPRNLPTPTRDGYIFCGWTLEKLDENFSGAAAVVTENSAYGFDKDTTIYAHWERERHTVHEKGPYTVGAEHPHYVFYTCTVCGEVFSDGVTENQPNSCAICALFQIGIDAGQAGTKTDTPDQETTPLEGSWGPWSEWSSTPVYASATREVETQESTHQVKISDPYTEYRYGGYVTTDGKHDCWCATYLRSKFGSASLRYSDWSTTQYTPNRLKWTCGFCKGNHINVYSYGSDGRAYWLEYTLANGQNYYWEESRTVAAQYESRSETLYRYRDLQN